MNQHLQSILNFIQQNESLPNEQKTAILKSLKDADKELEITAFKLDRTEKVKRTTAILLEETIEELEQKRKAVEAKNRDLEMESALERVRSRAMGMQKSEELKEVIKIVYQQLAHLKINLDHAGFVVDYTPLGNWHFWIADERHIPSKITHPYFDSVWAKQFNEAKEKGIDFFTTHLNFEEKNKFYQDLLKHIPGLTEQTKDFYFSCAGLGASTVLLGDIGLYIENFSGHPYSDEDNNILMRFAKVFQQTYTRFLDLQKAEAQAREAKIESALEKVRSRTMAMQHSSELGKASALLFQQIKSLGVLPWSCGFNIWEQGDTVFTSYMGSPDGANLDGYKIPLTEEVTFIHFRESRDRGDKLFIDVLEGERLEAHYQYFLSLPEIKKAFEKRAQAGQHRPTFQINHLANFSHGNLMFITYEPCPEMHDVFKRFAKVFEQTYTRFLDLQKAEAQAREAEIELSLERIRSKAMAMHGSGDILATTTTAFEELQKLGIHSIRCGIGLLSKNSMDAQVYAAATDSNGIFQTLVGVRDMNDHPSLTRQYESWLKKKNIVEVLQDEELTSYYNKLFFQSSPTTTIPQSFDKKQYGYYFSFADGLFYSWSDQPYSDNEKNILNRFNAIVALTFRRFLDLQKAEAQAREAQIELALERVRARTMAMQHSDELMGAANLLFQQVQLLGISVWSCGYNIWEKGEQFCTGWMSTNDVIQPSFRIPLSGNPTFVHMKESRLKEESFYVEEVSGEALAEHYRNMFSLPDFKAIADEQLKDGLSLPTFQINHVFNFKHGNLIFIAGEPIPEAWDIFKRFTKVFEQTYIRFLDLQKAEAQVREAQIELALERVRARTMAMQKSYELADIALALFQQVKELGITAWAAGFNIWQPDNLSYIDWITGPTGDFLDPYTVDLTRHPVFTAVSDARRRKDDFFVSVLEGEQIVEIYELLNSFANKGQFQKILDSGIQFPTRQFNHFVFGAQVSLLFITYEPCPEAWEIFKRFGKVFEQTYTRFLDLQKAEEQAREAKIEAALERVRSKTMAMQKGEELKEVAVLLYKELIALGVNNFVTCGYVEINEKINRQFTWVTSPGGDTFGLFYLPLTGDTTFDERYAAWKQQQIIFHQTVAGEVRRKHLEYAITTFNSKEAEEMVLSQFPDPTVFYCFNFSHGYLHLVSGSELKNEKELLLVRFTRVFEQTYARFLDLQKAEAQAREAKIEAALERVRSRSMAMQKSEELTEVAGLLFKQVTDLGIKSWTAGFNVWSDDNNSYVDYITSPNGGFIEPYTVLTNRAEALQDISNARKSGVEFDVQYVEGEKIKQLYIALTGLGEEQFEKMRQDGNQFPSHQYEHFVFGSRVSLMFITYEPAPEAHDIFKRFGKVFEQTYTRFLDLQKAEAQTREAQIQLAMERVRARTMAMQKSDELLDVASILFQQVKALGVPQWNCGFDIWDIGDKEFTYYPGSPDGIISPSPCNIPLTEHAVFRRFDESRRRGDDLLIYEKEGEEQADHYHYMLSLPGVGELLRSMLDAGFQLPTFQIDHVANFLYGNLIFITYEHFPEMHDVFKRFAKVFEQTYTRFLDLQKAEAQALETVKRASVDRVRAEIASMRTTNDLERITPLIWRELMTIGVPFIRCGVFIMDEEQQQVHTFLSTPDGKANASFHQPFSTPGEIAEIIKNWRTKQMYRQHWDEAQFIEFTKNLVEQGAVTSGEKYLTENRPTNLDLHFLPFLQGMLYVGNTTPLSDDELQLVQNLADAFSTAYARYDDFNKLESAKVQIEKTLVDLKQAQAQLVQSAKMASLGELTAGIAHEIQNPLNFVNNFSEVNKELIAEMKEEMDKGNLDDAKLIADDIAENEQKINHHGKRADAIVKGMLQHSRSSTATKELTNINALADEYLRLAYHGLRAKEKSFNATLKTDFDESIQKIDIIPQDIGRVILNLITNAFYTVAEKKKSPHPLKGGEVYEPVVTITTRRLGSPSGDVGKVEISVKDNGNGIPEKVVDKIFQPFFTTKPTGQGTGLGLSLAYDIVKTHGGDLTVESKEGEGSEFIIQLPIV